MKSLFIRILRLSNIQKKREEALRNERKLQEQMKQQELLQLEQQRQQLLQQQQQQELLQQQLLQQQQQLQQVVQQQGSMGSVDPANTEIGGCKYCACILYMILFYRWSGPCYLPTLRMYFYHSHDCGVVL